MTAVAPNAAGPRPVRAPRGTSISCKGWPQEAALRMLMNNLDPDVAERPDDLVVYGGTGKAARDWASFDAIVAALRALEGDDTLLVQSGKPVGVFRTHADAQRVLIANSNLVPRWGTWEHVWELEKKGLIARITETRPVSTAAAVEITPSDVTAIAEPAAPTPESETEVTPAPSPLREPGDGDEGPLPPHTVPPTQAEEEAPAAQKPPADLAEPELATP